MQTIVNTNQTVLLIEALAMRVPSIIFISLQIYIVVYICFYI